LGVRTGQAGVNENITRYALGIGEVSGNQTAVTQGADGTKGGATELMGSESAKTGVYALADVDIFNILSIPESAALSDAEAKTLIGKAAAYAEKRRAFYIVDPPDVGGGSPETLKDWHASLGLQSKNSAIYFPRVRLSDPLENYRIGPFAPSGTMAGLYARTDSSRGVWKAPAGTGAGLRVAGLDVPMTDDQNGILNKLGINCLRTFPIYGRVSWGARTFEGADQKASEWKYVPVRRTALYIEESLFRGLKWAVFEPNGETLWAQIRVAAGGFMNNLFRQGAFKGTSPREAYFVKCDAETTTQNDIDLGIVNVVVGFAPLKPAEFVVIKIQQIAGQVQT
jgi:phage tail sheath protein FI